MRKLALVLLLAAACGHNKTSSQPQAATPGGNTPTAKASDKDSKVDEAANEKNEKADGKDNDKDDDDDEGAAKKK